MQRRNFLKGIFGVIAATGAASVPMFAKENDDTFALGVIAFYYKGTRICGFSRKIVGSITR